MSTKKVTSVTVQRLPELIAYYEVCNRAEGKSAKTITWYSTNLRRFGNYLKNKHLSNSIDRIDTKLLREYAFYLQKRTRYDHHPYTPAKEEPLSSATVHGHVRTLRAFFNWLTIEGLIETPPRI
jgi:integrase/recombinase XerD